MFYEPTRTFATLEGRKAAWLPSLLLVLSMTALLLWYFSIVDYAWLLEQMMASIDSTAEREKMASLLSPNAMKATSIGGAVVGLMLILAVFGLYFMIVGKAISKEFSYGAGFALAAWSSVPSLLALPLGAMQIMLASNRQFGFSELNPLSLNTLIFHYDQNHPMAALLDSVSIITVWSAILAVIGFQAWAKVSRAAAIKAVFIPYLTVYAVWLAISLRTAA